MKILVNSAYGYMGAVGLTRFADVHAANEVTRRGREVLGLLCRELAARGAHPAGGRYRRRLLRRARRLERGATSGGSVAEVAALLPPLVRLEFEGRYAAMLSHEPKNYALLAYDDKLMLRGVAFRSSRAEPFGEVVSARARWPACCATTCLACGAVYVETVDALRAALAPDGSGDGRVRLTKTPAAVSRDPGARRELSYEAMLPAGGTQWSRASRCASIARRVARAALLRPPRTAMPSADPRDYDAAY